MEIWELKPPGTLWATPGLLRDPFTFTFTERVKTLVSMCVKSFFLWIHYNTLDVKTGVFGI
jgi:hypothetical protein